MSENPIASDVNASGLHDHGAPVADIIATIPLFSQAAGITVAPLSGVISLNNRNYRVEAEGKVYFLRVGSDTARFLGIQRETEIESARAAADIGMGPAILYADPTGIMVMPFIAGTSWDADMFHHPENIRRLGQTLCRLHSIQKVQASGSPYRRIERLLESALTLGMELPKTINLYRDKLSNIEDIRLSDPRYVPGLAHNDFWANNFLDDGEQLYLVDWEFAGTGDGLIDLATISMGSNYSEEEQRALLTAYGLTQPEDFTTLQTMKWVVCFFEAAWALVMHGIRSSGRTGYRGESDFNYKEHSRRMFEHLTVS